MVDNKMVKKHPIQRMMEETRRGVAPRNHDHKHENALIIAYQNGDDRAGFELVKLYQDIFSMIISKPTDAPYNGGRMRKLWDGSPSYYDYEDMYQEILTQFLELLKGFDVSGEAPFQAVCVKLLHQRFFNRYFSEFIESRDQELSYDDAILFDKPSSTEEEDTKKVPSEYAQLYSALDRLSKRQREVVEMSIVKGWSSTFIAEELGMSDNTVRVHLKRGLEKLKTILGVEENDKSA